MDKFLYFSTGQGADATTEAAVYPLSRMVGIDPISATTTEMKFLSADPKLGGTTAVYYDVITFTHTSAANLKVIKDIFKAIGKETFKDSTPLVVICDGDNSEFASSDISSCTIEIGQAS